MKNNTDDKANTNAAKTTGEGKQKSDPDTIIVDMPEVKDIPGQEHIKVPDFKEMQDTTVSSADEEGEGILDDLNSDEQSTITNSSSDVGGAERQALKKSTGHQPTDETRDFDQMALDDRDEDGDLLNETGIRQNRNGEDLDVPGAELDDENEDIGEEDEENNYYSQGQKDS
jgi:hypothetical protein